MQVKSIKLPFVLKIFALSTFEWLFYTGFTVYTNVNWLTTALTNVKHDWKCSCNVRSRLVLRSGPDCFFLKIDLATGNHVSQNHL